MALFGEVLEFFVRCSFVVHKLDWRSARHETVAIWIQVEADKSGYGING